MLNFFLTTYSGPMTSEQQTSSSTAPAGKVQVVVTREAGKNDKLLKALEAKGIACLEMPLIETSAGPDR